MLESIVLNVFDVASCEEFLTDLRSIAGEAATVHGTDREAAVAPAIRKATRLTVPPAARSRVMGKLVARRREIEDHFGLNLGEPEEPQFLRYAAGDYFVAHQDGNTPLVYDESRFRRISVVIFLNPQSEQPKSGSYGGGSLMFHGRYPEHDLRQVVPPVPGTLVAFRSETTHEVTPLTHGERYTIASWYRTP